MTTAIISVPTIFIGVANTDFNLYKNGHFIELHANLCRSSIMWSAAVLYVNIAMSYINNLGPC